MNTIVLPVADTENAGLMSAADRNFLNTLSSYGAVVYQGTWNATTNTPALSSGVGTKGYYYKVSVAGTAAIDGNSQWNVGDTIIFDGSTWDKIDGISNEVVSVAGLYGVISASGLKSALAISSGDVSGLGALATLSPGTGVATALGYNVNAANGVPELNANGQLTSPLSGTAGPNVQNANYPFALTDLGNTVVHNDTSSAYTWILPPSSSVPWPTAYVPVIYGSNDQSAGTLTIAPGLGVTLISNGLSGAVTIPVAGNFALLYFGSDTWVLRAGGGVALPVDVLRSDASANLTAGFTATSYSLGTITSGTTTLSAANGNIQRATNGGIFTLAPQTGASSIQLDITNNGSAGAITTSGYTYVVGTFDTTSSHAFRCYSSVGAAGSLLVIQAMQ